MLYRPLRRVPSLITLVRTRSGLATWVTWLALGHSPHLTSQSLAFGHLALVTAPLAWGSNIYSTSQAQSGLLLLLLLIFAALNLILPPAMIHPLTNEQLSNVVSRANPSSAHDHEPTSLSCRVSPLFVCFALLTHLVRRHLHRRMDRRLHPTDMGELPAQIGRGSVGDVHRALAVGRLDKLVWSGHGEVAPDDDHPGYICGSEIAQKYSHSR